MVRCDRCGEEETMPYRCRYCGGQFCGAHRLPENHDCPGLEDYEGGPGIFDSGFDASVRTDRQERSILKRVGIDTSPGGPLAYVRNNTTYVLLLAMWLTFIAQWAILLLAGERLHRAIFVLTPQHPEYVWTWVTSVFAHDPFLIFHIVFNSIVIFFFGPPVERYLGSTRFVLLFIVSGILAGLTQIGFQILEGVSATGGGVVGASGAALAVMGVLTIVNPRLRVYLYAVIPLPIWVLTVGIAAISFLFIGAGVAGAGQIAHAAHLVGVLIGLAYGAYVKRSRDLRAPTQLNLGRSGGMNGPGRRRW